MEARARHHGRLHHPPAAEIRDFCDGLTVLRNGAVVGTYGINGVSEDEAVRLMIGRDLKAAFPDHASAHIGCPP